MRAVLLFSILILGPVGYAAPRRLELPQDPENPTAVGERLCLVRKGVEEVCGAVVAVDATKVTLEVQSITPLDPGAPAATPLPHTTMTPAPTPSPTGVRGPAKGTTRWRQPR